MTSLALKPWPRDAVIIVCATPAEARLDQMEAPVPGTCRDCGGDVLADLHTLRRALAHEARRGRPVQYMCCACAERYALDSIDELTDDRLHRQRAADREDLGPCCACGAIGPQVRNLLLLDFRAPEPGQGWGCAVCGLPPDGAMAVLCDKCLAAERPPRLVCVGPPAEGRRVSAGKLGGPFGHDLSRHPELQEIADERP